jgi:hypothetical protein
MSSHHFVKDGQEPSVWVMDIHYDSEVLGSLLEWCPLVYVCEPAIEKVLSEGVKIDVALSNEAENEEVNEWLQNQFPIEIRVVKESFSEIMAKVNAGNQSPIHILGWKLRDGKAFLLQLPEAVRAGRILFAEGRRIRAVHSSKYEKWLPKGSIVNIHTKEKTWTYESEKDGVFSVEIPDGAIVEDQI